MTKKFKLSALAVLISASLSADCLIISSPATNLKLISGVDARAQSISKIYYDENGKMQIKGYADAYIQFFSETTKNIKADCKKYNISNIYNLKIESSTDKNYYYFNATYDF
ncbi:MAG: hypothetical protein U9Q40_06085 [Campylobacterota bacterium]|nr:hypothetical protein [Campylobacterota bacterium]